jgi:CRP/FNR family transcriptional regulator, dissimilatory nitrate respiration regulator
VLREVGLFSALSEPLLETVAADTREQRLARGDVLFRAGEPCTAFFCVLTGQITLTVASGGGAVKVLELIGPGETFAEAVMFAGRPYPVTAVALAPTRLLAVGARTVFDLVGKDPDFARLMLVGMSARLHSLVRQIAAVSLSSAAGRVADLLLSPCGSAPALEGRREPGERLVLHGPTGAFGLRESGLRPRWFAAGAPGWLRCCRCCGGWRNGASRTRHASSTGSTPKTNYPSCPPWRRLRTGYRDSPRSRASGSPVWSGPGAGGRPPTRWPRNFPPTRRPARCRTCTSPALRCWSTPCSGSRRRRGCPQHT